MQRVFATLVRLWLGLLAVALAVGLALMALLVGAGITVWALLRGRRAPAVVHIWRGMNARGGGHVRGAARRPPAPHEVIDVVTREVPAGR